MKEEIKAIKKDIKDIKDNHLYHIQKDISTMAIAMATLATNQKWLMKFFWIIATASVGGLIAGIANLIKVL